MAISNLVIGIITIISAIHDAGSTNCQKCYRLEACELKNCSSVYGLLDTTYREHFFIGEKEVLPICPAESDESAWQKLEVDGNCGSQSLRNQPCGVAHFKMSGVSLKSNKLNGVFVGCPKESLLTPLLPNFYRCVDRRNENVEYNHGIVLAQNRYIDLRLKVTLCNSKCALNPWKCTLCFGNGCIYPNNTSIMMEAGSSELTGLIAWGIVGISVIVALTFLFAAFCQPDRIGKLDLIRSQEGMIIPKERNDKITSSQLENSLIE